MKKKLPRIMACLMACLIAFNVIAIPKAKASAAVVGTSALATSALASYMTATGVPLTVISGGAGAVSAGAASLISGYAAATGGTYSVVTTAIASGVTIGTGGVILISAAAAAVLAGITAWIISEHGVNSDIPVRVSENTHGVFLVNGSPIPFGYAPHNANYIDATKSGTFCFDANEEYIFASGAKFSKAYRGEFGYWFIDVTLPNGEVSDFRLTSYLNDVVYYGWYICDTDYNTANPLQVFAVGETEYDAGYHTSFDRLFAMGGTEPQEMSASLSDDYASLPELAPLEVIEIASGLPTEIAPEAVPDAIFEKIGNNEFEPTYKVTVPAGDSDSDPDPNPNPDGDGGSDSDTGLDTSESIGWLKRIALACEALADKILGGIESIFDPLADKILGGIESIFAPDPALMQEIADIFTSKFGFVTTLHELGSDLLSISADSEPPVVYIHLEDAEGVIDYGGTVKALDMTWYSRYKAEGDGVLSGFLWLGFVWMLFKRIPSIIKGTSMETDERSKL